MGIPAGSAIDFEAFLGFVAAKQILEGSGHDVVDARQPIGRGWALVKNEFGTFLADRLGKNILGLPISEHLLLDLGQVERAALGKFLAHRAAMHFNSTAMGVGNESTSTVVRQGLGFTSAK